MKYYLKFHKKSSVLCEFEFRFFSWCLFVEEHVIHGPSVLENDFCPCIIFFILNLKLLRGVPRTIFIFSTPDQKNSYIQLWIVMIVMIRAIITESMFAAKTLVQLARKFQIFKYLVV